MFEVGPRSDHVLLQCNSSEVRDSDHFKTVKSQVEDVLRKCRASSIYEALPAYF